jgi:RimJ/RimL family protein N-acetyltransferase
MRAELAAKSIKTHSITLREGDITLRPMTEEDWDLLRRWNQDPEILYFTEGVEGRSYDMEAVHRIYRSVSQNAYCFIIEYNGEPIGECWLQKMNRERIIKKHPGKDCRRIDMMIGEKGLWGHGIGSRVMKMLAELGFMKDKADIIVINPYEDNVRCIKASRNAGFEADARYDDMPFGTSHYSIDMVLTKERFLRLRERERGDPSAKRETMHKRHEHGGASSRGVLEPEPILKAIGLKGGDVLLDAGCGDGHFSIAASDMVGRSGKVYAVDFYEKGVDALKKEIDKKGIRNVEALVADMTKVTPIDDGAIDVCIMVNVLHGIVANGEIDDTMRELVRVIRSGGTLGIVDFKRKRGLFGPPMSIKLSPEMVESAVAPFHFAKEKVLDLGPAHYAIVLRRA